MTTKTLVKFSSETDLKQVLAKTYIKQIQNYFGDEKQALEFLSNVVACVQRNPKLLECTPETLLNSFVTMASLKLMPSAVSGEAYVLPYRNKDVMEAQFQIGYKGLVTLLYRAGNREVIAELVREQDVFRISRGKIVHEVDPRKTQKERGVVIGAYAIIVTPTGGTVEQYMTITDIRAHAQKFSKAFGSNFSPWNEEQDPQGWMPRKTVLIQAQRLAPRSGELMRALAEDFKDSTLHDKEQALPELKVAPVDLDFHRAAINLAKDMEALERVWADVPGDARAALREDMEAVKARITEGAVID